MPYRPYDQNQQFLLPPRLDEWINKDNPARVFSDVIDRLDISGFQEIKAEGRPRFDTKMMLKILIWGYANGVRASRKIAKKVHSDIEFMWLAGLEKPDFRTICLFRKSNLTKLNYLFSQVILLAKGLNLIRLGLIALDGTKVRASASVDTFKDVKDWTDELAQIQAEVGRILSEAEQADARDDAQYGPDKRGDEIPKELEGLEARRRKIEDLINKVGGKKDTQIRVSGTDPECKFMHSKNGSIPAYNCELAVSEDQIIVHADVTTEPIDTNQLTPALDGIENTCGEKPVRLLADAGFNSGKNMREMESRDISGYIPGSSEENIGKDLTGKNGFYSKEDFKYNHQEDCYVCPAGNDFLPRQENCLKTKYSQRDIIVYRAQRGICLACPDKSRCTVTNNPIGRSITRSVYEEERIRMKNRLTSEEGKNLYKKRKTIVEPVIGQIKTVGGFVQFLLRGLAGAKIEWKWATIAHNLLKITRKVVSGERKLTTATA